MARKQTVLMLGVWLVVLPFLGFPAAWKTGLSVVTGVVLIIVYIYRRSSGKECQCHLEKDKMRSEVFVDNRNSALS